MKKVFCYISLIVMMLACGEPLVPKPRGYFRITLPEHEYVSYDSVGEPYGFEYPTLASVEPDVDQNAEPHWINVNYKDLRCKIHVTYRDIHGDVEEALEDSRKLVYKHTIKADAIGESYYEDAARRVYGTLYRIRGNAATPLQFALTDSTRHLFRGSVYFYTKPNADSLAPVVAYIEDDIAHIVETFNWK